MPKFVVRLVTGLVLLLLMVVGLGLTDPVRTHTTLHASGKQPGVVRVFVGFEPRFCQGHRSLCTGWRVLARALFALRPVSPGWHPLAQELWRDQAHPASALCDEEQFPQGDVVMDQVGFAPGSERAHSLDAPTWTGVGYEGLVRCVPSELVKVSANFVLDERRGHFSGKEEVRREAARLWRKVVEDHRTPKGQRCRPACEPEVLFDPPSVRGVARCQ